MKGFATPVAQPLLRNGCCARRTPKIHGTCILIFVPGLISETDPSVSTEPLNAVAVGDLDLLLESAAELRAQLRQFEAALRKVRGFLARGGATSELRDVLDIVTAREELTQAANNFQANRHSQQTVGDS